MNVYLLRHGRTSYNDQHRYQGRLDIPLSQKGSGELHAADFSPACVYVSPLLRARQTARILFPTARLEIVEPFAEMDFGDFDGRTADEMSGDAAYRAWVEGRCEGRCPNGESLAELRQRSCNAFAALLSKTASEKRAHLIIVAHSGTVCAVMERFSLPTCSYFDANPPLGGGYILDYAPALWERERRLQLRKTVQYRRDETEC